MTSYFFNPKKKKGASQGAQNHFGYASSYATLRNQLFPQMLFSLDRNELPNKNRQQTSLPVRKHVRHLSLQKQLGRQSLWMTTRKLLIRNLNRHPNNPNPYWNPKQLPIAKLLAGKAGLLCTTGGVLLRSCQRPSSNASRTRAKQGVRENGKKL